MPGINVKFRLEDHPAGRYDILDEFRAAARRQNIPIEVYLPVLESTKKKKSYDELLVIIKANSDDTQPD
jgi:sRNA-binding regulator protein Hfq